MSSCGLIWLNYGVHILRRLGLYRDLDEDVLAETYREFFAGIDATDNGVEYIADLGVATNYVQPLSLSFCIDKLNSTNGGFRKAVNTAKVLIDGYLRDAISTARLVRKEHDMLASALHNAAADEIMILSSPSRSVNTFMRRHDANQQVKLIVLPDTASDTTQWRIYTVQYRGQRFEPYIRVSRDSRGFAEDEFNVHSNQFVGFAKSLDVAVQMARRSVVEYYAVTHWPARLRRYLLQ
jgi:uncharacterized UPF0160 family protein